MTKQIKNYRRYLFLGIIIISLGITFSTALKEKLGALGTVFIAIGGLLFIIGIRKKRLHDKLNNK